LRGLDILLRHVYRTRFRTSCGLSWAFRQRLRPEYQRRMLARTAVERQGREKQLEGRKLRSHSPAVEIKFSMERSMHLHLAHLVNLETECI
jgi:hypothetical protein